MVRSKQFSDRPKEAILDELGSVKDLLNSFEDTIEDILARHPQPAADIPLLSDVVASATTAAYGPLPPTAAPPSSAATDPDSGAHAVPAAVGGSVIAVDLDRADVEELEQLVFSDDGPALASASAAPPAAPSRLPGAAARTQRALDQLPHLVDDVIDAHIPRLRAELLARLRALIEFADEPQT